MPNGEVLDELNLIPFVGELRAKVLRENGIRDVETLLKYPIEKLAELDGFSMKIAQKIRRYAAEVESLGLVGKEPIKELVLREFRCPRCNAIVSSGESVCHRCGKVFYPAPPNAEEIIANSHFEVLKNPDDPQIWRKRAMILENLGLHNESTICMLKVDFLEMFESEKKPQKEEIKRAVKKGLVNGNGVVANNGVVGGLFPKIAERKIFPFLIAIMIILPIIILSTSLATRGIEIDGYFDDWKNIKGIELYSQDNLIQEVKYYHDGRTFIYIKFGENVFVSPKKYYYTIIGVFFDTDMNNASGYKIGGIGADNALLIYGYEGKIISAKFMNYKGEGIDWKWDSGVKVRAKTDGREIEVGLPNIDKFAAIIVYRDAEGEVVSSTFSTSKGVFCIITDDDTNVISTNENICTIKLYPLSPDGTTVSLKIVNRGTAKDASFHILDEAGNVISTMGEISQLRIDKPMDLTVVYTGGASSGESLYLDVKIDGKSYVKNYARGKYVDTEPSSPVIDGIYADWDYISDKIGDSTDKDVDICWAAVYSKDNATMLSFAVVGEMLKGIYMPVSLYMDSDRDTIPDPIDEYPNDFNNDGIPDSESKTPDGKPDIDKDGIADYPYGDDRWLNITIDGRNVSIRLGEGGKTIGYVNIYIISKNEKISLQSFNGKIVHTSTQNLKWRHNNRYIELLINSKLDNPILIMQYNNLFADKISLSNNSLPTILKNQPVRNALELNNHYNKCTAAFSKPIKPRFLGVYNSLRAVFGRDVNVTQTPNDYLESRPSITVTSNGTIWVTFNAEWSSNDRDVKVAYSTDGGATWRAVSLDTTYDDTPNAVIISDSNDNIYVFFENHTSSTSYFQFYMFNSTTSKWTLYYISAWTWWDHVYNISAATYTVGNDVYIYVFFEYEYSTTDYDIGYIKTTDGGKSWWNYNDSIGHRGLNDKHPSVAISAGATTPHVYVAYDWYDTSAGKWNVTVLNNTDINSTTWWGWVFNGSYSFCYPSICASGNYAYFVGQYGSTERDLYLFNTTNNGLDWGNPLAVATTADDEVYANVIADGLNVYVFYINATTNNICEKESADGGYSWKSFSVVSDVPYAVAGYRNVMAYYNSTQKIYVVWCDNRSGNYEIFFDKTVMELSPINWYVALTITITPLIWRKKKYKII